jgi:hypothetical protein
MNGCLYLLELRITLTIVFPLMIDVRVKEYQLNTFKKEVSLDCNDEIG